MKLLAALSLLFFAAPAPEIRYFQFERPIAMPAQTSGQACMVVDPAVFAHASAGLADLRIYQGATETPYVVHSEVPVLPADQSISPINLGKSEGQTVFDAEMPDGTYSDIQLEVSGHDFLATVTVSGNQAKGGGSRTKLGSFTIFDLTRQRLGRSTVLHLPESDFRYLHFQIAGPVAPENVTGLSVTRPRTLRSTALFLCPDKTRPTSAATSRSVLRRFKNGRPMTAASRLHWCRAGATFCAFTACRTVTGSMKSASP